MTRYCIVIYSFDLFIVLKLLNLQPKNPFLLEAIFIKKKTYIVSSYYVETFYVVIKLWMKNNINCIKTLTNVIADLKNCITTFRRIM